MNDMQRVNALGFKCPYRKSPKDPECGLDYGWIEVIVPQIWNIHRKTPKRRVELTGKRNSIKSKIEETAMKENDILTPVHDAWKKTIISEAKTKQIKDLLLKLPDFISSPSFYTLPEEDKKEIVKQVLQGIRDFEQRMNNRLVELEKEDQGDALWDVIERIDELDSSIIRLMRTLGRHVTEYLDNEKELETAGEDKKFIRFVRWNPVKEIKAVRTNVNNYPFSELALGTNEPFDLYRKIISYYKRDMYEIIPPNAIDLSRSLKGFLICNEFLQNLRDRKAYYKWNDWFWITRYAEVYTPKKAMKMLIYLDGENGKISRKRIREQQKRIPNKWREFVEYGLGFFLPFRAVVTLFGLYGNNQELREEFRNVLLEKKISSAEFEKEVLQNAGLSLSLFNNDVITSEQELIVNAIRTKRRDNIRDMPGNSGTAELAKEYIRVSHPNLKYNEEIEQIKRSKSHYHSAHYHLQLEEECEQCNDFFKRKLRPKKKIEHTFHPSELSYDVRTKLQQDGKLSYY